MTTSNENISTISKVDEIIRNRAEKRLNDDIAALSSLISSSAIASAFRNSKTVREPRIKFNATSKKDEVKETEDGFFNAMYYSFPFMRELKRLLTPEYIAAEATAFFEQVDSLSSNVNDLMKGKYSRRDEDGY